MLERPDNLKKVSAKDPNLREVNPSESRALASEVASLTPMVTGLLFSHWAIEARASFVF